MTFQRHHRPAFPFRNIILLALIVAAFLVFILKSLSDRPQRPAPATEPGEEKRDSGLRPAEWWYALRDYPDFRPDPAAYTEALEAARRLAAQRGPSPGFSTPWTLEGPANIGARINTIKVNPADPNTIYVGYSGGGLWKTTDGGQSWQPVFDDRLFLSIGDIELDPQNPDVVYAGTGDPNISAYPFIGDGLWRSPDGGQSWEHLGLENQRIISKIIVDPADPDVLLVATMGLPFVRDDQRGIYRSTNGGQSWTQVLFVADSVGIIEMEASASNPSVVYAASWDRIRSNSESLVSGLNARIWKSVDAGLTWAPLSGGLPLTERSRPGLAVDPTDADHVFVTFAGAGLSFDGIYETTDGGASWTELPAPGLDPNFQGNFAWYFGKIAINPFNPQDIWLLGVYSLRSQDGGATWDYSNSFDVHADHHDLAFVGPQSFLLASDGGLWRSDDDDNSWVKTENIPTTQFYRVATNPHQPAFYYGGAQDNGTLGGHAGLLESWFSLYGADGFQPAFHPSNPDIFYCEWQNGGLVGSTDGFSLQDATEGLPPGDRRHWDMPYIISPHDPEVMFTGTYRLFQSFGHLPSWGLVSEDLTDGLILAPRFHVVSALDESPVVQNLLYVGTTDGNVWRGELAAPSWTNVTEGLPNRYVSSVKGSPSDPDRVFVSHTGYKDNDFTPRIHRSDDRGDTWVAINGDLPNLAVNDLLVLPGYQDMVLFAATDGGVWATLDGGAHWERLGVNFPFVPVYDLDRNVAANTLVAGTHARGILSFPIDSLPFNPSTTAGDAPRTNPSLQVWPTLSAGGPVKIGVEHPKAQATEIVVADMNGRICWQAAFGAAVQTARTLDTAAFAPGVYVAFARTGGKVWAQQKFVVTRS